MSLLLLTYKNITFLVLFFKKKKKMNKPKIKIKVETNKSLEPRTTYDKPIDHWLGNTDLSGPNESIKGKTVDPTSYFMLRLITELVHCPTSIICFARLRYKNEHEPNVNFAYDNSSDLK